MAMISFVSNGFAQSCLRRPHFNYLLVQPGHDLGKFNTVTCPDPGQAQPIPFNSKPGKNFF